MRGRYARQFRVKRTLAQQIRGLQIRWQWPTSGRHLPKDRQHGTAACGFHDTPAVFADQLTGQRHFRSVGPSARYHALMPEVTGETQAHRQSRYVPQPPGGGGLSRWLAPAALLVAVVAGVLAVWALMSASSGASVKLAGDPKMRVCTAFNAVSQAVTGQTHNDLGPDPVAQAAVAGNARLALLGGGQYLLSRLDSATPSELADPVRSFANDLQDIGIYALAGVPNTDAVQAGRLTQADLTRKQIVDLCK